METKETTLEKSVLFQDKNGPIEEFSWGRFVVAGQEHARTPEGRVGKGKDIRLIGTEVKRWKNRIGHHLKRSMITGAYKKDVEVLIIGTGVDGQIVVPDKVREDVAAYGIATLVIEPTPEACRVYNQLHREGKRVVMYAHGTC